MPRNRRSRLAALSILLLFPACNALNPLCGSARPAPTITSVSPNALTFAQVQQGVVLVVNGTQFVSSSEIVVNGIVLTTTVTSSLQMQANVTTAEISGAGVANVQAKTPSGNSGSLGCSSGGISATLQVTIT